MTKLSQRECLDEGGHCFELPGTVLLSNPAQCLETCKHCGTMRTVTPQKVSV